MTSQQLTGGCLCGAVRYECALPASSAAFCHCQSCRRATGAHVVAWMTVPVDSFRFTSGTAARIASSSAVIRQFCGRCGSSMTYWNRSWPNTVDVTLATLDRPDAVTPADHIWMSDAVSWDEVTDGRPQYPEWRA